MKYTIPAKTFLLGEYSALVGGSVVGLATGPGFEVSYHDGASLEFPFSPKSPAGLLWNENVENRFDFTDLMGVGGFGKSTAEYLSVLIPTLKPNTSLETMIKDYQNLSEKSGARASGLDLAIQYLGKVASYSQVQRAYTSQDWKFPELEFFLVVTGNKVKTHVHLESFDLKKIEKFPEVSNPLVETFLAAGSAEAVRVINEWANFLASEGLTHGHSQGLVAELKKNSDVLCAKPCGAMGADVIVVVCDREKSLNVKHKISELGLVIKGSSKDLSVGVKDQLHFDKVGSLHVD